MRLKLAFLCMLSFGIIGAISAQQKYKGTLTTKLGKEMPGLITVNLTGENEELIEITSTEKTKGKGSKQTITTSARLNVAIIKSVTIDGKTYYFRDIRIGYDDKMLKNVCVQLILGTVDCGIFQSGGGKEEHSIAIKFPKAPLSELASVDFDYYRSSASVPMRISDCEALLNKMVANDETVTWTEVNSRDERIQRFKNIINEYNSCNKAN